jgi:hypothetical protein
MELDTTIGEDKLEIKFVNRLRRGTVAIVLPYKKSGENADTVDGIGIQI